MSDFTYKRDMGVVVNDDGTCAHVYIPINKTDYHVITIYGSQTVRLEIVKNLLRDKLK